MKYDDCLIPSTEAFEEMAKAYSNSLKEQGFVFIRLSNESYNFLLDEIFDIMFKLRSSYRFLDGFMDTGLLFKLNEQQIDSLRHEFSYSKNRAFQIRSNKTKVFINTISLENKLTIKLNELAQKSDKFDEISKLILERLSMCNENYRIEGIFNNLSNLKLD